MWDGVWPGVGQQRQSARNRQAESRRRMVNSCPEDAASFIMVMIDIDIRPVTAENWGDFGALFEARGGPHYCWCSLYRIPGGHHLSKAEKRMGMQRLVMDAVPIGVLAYDGDGPVGWYSTAPRQMGSRPRWLGSRR